ncbi:MAG: nucleotide exchange factor GrpE [Clostridium sp.]|uniref:nucleotide exchange factor GrpE n=1 Tax=Clostridium sp. TaxID=1506 RepID=UPI003F38CEB3
MEIDRKIEDYIKRLEKNINEEKEKICEEDIEKEKTKDLKKDIKRVEEKLNKIEGVYIHKEKLRERILSKDEEKLLKGIIGILDGIDWIYNEELDVKIRNRARLSKKIIKRELENMNISINGEVGELYNENFQMGVGEKTILEKDENQILEVLRQGYFYKGKLLRKAEVIVNTKGVIN